MRENQTKEGCPKKQKWIPIILGILLVFFFVRSCNRGRTIDYLDSNMEIVSQQLDSLKDKVKDTLFYVNLYNSRLKDENTALKKRVYDLENSIKDIKAERLTNEKISSELSKLNNNLNNNK